MTSCGWSQKCGDAKRDTPACKFNSYITSGPVPGDAGSAYAAAFGAAGDCSSLGFSNGCPSIDDFWKAANLMDKEYIHEGELDWQKADSILFNAFIWLQVRGGGVGWAGMSYARRFSLRTEGLEEINLPKA
jgi:hypothetical protein